MSRSLAMRTIRKAGLVLCVLLAASLVGSLYWGGGYIGATRTIVLSRGAVAFLIYTRDPGDYVGWIGYGIAANSPDPAVRWWPSYDDSISPAAGPYPAQRTRRLVLPLWIPWLFVAMPTVILWRREARGPVGCCAHCGYDLTGNVTGVCSECGLAVRRRC